VYNPTMKRKRLLESTAGRESTTGEFGAKVATIDEPTSATSEAYRTLRTNLIYSLVDEPPKVIVLTSPGPGEGKSTTCANLGVVLAQAGKEVLIVDCDFRKPVMHKFFGMRNLLGVVDVLAGEHTLQEVTKQPVGGLTVMPVGHIPPNPTELLGTQRFKRFLTGVRQTYDYVLIDAPPAGIVSDAAILASQSDGVLLVLDAQKSRKRSVWQAMRSLETVGANVLGTVMNNVRVSNEDYHYRYGYERGA
jgi:capsular exopolysaccharide synthesis family protein